jgi:hypothetical protein
MPTIKIVPFPGVPGPQGPRGLQGIQGETGLTGPMGPAGETGPMPFNYQGNFDYGVTYAGNDAVTFQGGLWKLNNFIGAAGYAPTPGQWTLIIPAGEAGADGADGEDATPVTETSFTVNGGTTGTQPTFDGAPLFSGSYVKAGPMVHFQIQVDMDNITDFGTGQYYVELPFPAKYSYHFRDACLHDSSGTVRQYALSGHVYAGQSQVTLWFTSTSGQDELFDYNSPALLTANDNFHISGTYIAE